MLANGVVENYPWLRLAAHRFLAASLIAFLPAALSVLLGFDCLGAPASALALAHLAFWAAAILFRAAALIFRLGCVDSVATVGTAWPPLSS